MKPITLADAVKSFQNGEKVLLVEFRHSKAETINYRDKVTQKPMAFSQIRHSIEVGDAPAVVAERVPEGFVPETYKSPLTKGTKALLRFDSCTVEKGITHFNGTLLPING